VLGRRRSVERESGLMMKRQPGYKKSGRPYGKGLKNPTFKKKTKQFAQKASANHKMSHLMHSDTAIGGHTRRDAMPEEQCEQGEKPAGKTGPTPISLSVK